MHCFYREKRTVIRGGTLTMATDWCALGVVGARCMLSDPELGHWQVCTQPVEGGWLANRLLGSRWESASWEESHSHWKGTPSPWPSH